VVIEGTEHGCTAWSERRDLLRSHLNLLEARFDDLVQDVRLCSFVWVRDHETGLAPPGTHPHGQLFALPVVLPTVPEPNHDSGLALCSHDGSRAVLVTAPQADFEVRIVPTRDPSSTALVLWRVLVAMERSLAAPPISCAWVRNAEGPLGCIRVRPWLGTPGGLDLVGAGFVTQTPESCAARLRGALP
jgi:hypothetical protein